MRACVRACERARTNRQTTADSGCATAPLSYTQRRWMTWAHCRTCRQQGIICAAVKAGACELPAGGTQVVSHGSASLARRRRFPIHLYGKERTF